MKIKKLSQRKLANRNGSSLSAAVPTISKSASSSTSEKRPHPSVSEETRFIYENPLIEIKSIKIAHGRVKRGDHVPKKKGNLNLTIDQSDRGSNLGSIISNDQVTRTKSTVESYRIRILGIIKMACVDGYVSDCSDVNPTEIAEWLIGQKGRYCAATFRQYRAAIMLWIEECSHTSSADAIAILKATNHVQHLKRQLSNNTSATKEKKLSDKDRNSIIDWLNSHPSRYSKMVTVLLRIGPEVGLRPCEWKSARVIKNTDGKYVLQVVNAKCTNGRANGNIRTLVLDDVPKVIVSVIEKSAIYFRKLDESGEWNRIYNGCRKTLYRACRSLWTNRKKYPTLYSLRHQFAANAKSAGLSKIEVASLMGHGSLDTAGESYGKESAGRGSCAVKPSGEDVERLEINNSTFPIIKPMK